MKQLFKIKYYALILLIMLIIVITIILLSGSSIKYTHDWVKGVVYYGRIQLQLNQLIAKNNIFFNRIETDSKAIVYYDKKHKIYIYTVDGKIIGIRNFSKELAIDQYRIGNILVDYNTLINNSNASRIRVYYIGNNSDLNSISYDVHVILSSENITLHLYGDYYVDGQEIFENKFVSYSKSMSILMKYKPDVDIILK